jgi:hypothetical protein
VEVKILDQDQDLDKQAQVALACKWALVTIQDNQDVSPQKDSMIKETFLRILIMVA